MTKSEIVKTLSEPLVLLIERKHVTPTDLAALAGDASLDVWANDENVWIAKKDMMSVDAPNLKKLTAVAIDR